MKFSKFAMVVLSAFYGAIGHAQLPAYLPTNGLVAWYPFNGNANDESGNGNNGLVNGASLTADRFNQNASAYDFNGIDNFIEVTHSPELQFFSNLTISCWVKIEDYSTNPTWGTRTILSKPRGYLGSGLFLYSVNETVGVYGGGVFNSWPDGYSVNSSEQLPLNDWENIILTYDGSFLRLYKNGELINSTYSTIELDPATTPLYIGREFLSDPPNYSRWFKGSVDDIVLYNRALTESEITALYTATASNTGGGTTSTSTAPPGIPYQAEVRNDNGEVLANADVNLRFTLHELTANGAVSYQETQALTTNELGLFAATIGAGTATQGTFAGINWAQTTKFLQVEVDAGNGYITMGNQQLMSVPYALYAANGPAGPQGPAGADGQPGEPGPQGETGVGISNATLTNGDLSLQLSNGESISLGQVGLPQNTPVTATTQTNSTANYSNLSDVELPSFLNYYGNCTLGNRVIGNNELLPINSSYCNLRIPLGVTAKINAAKTTFIYVSDTLFLDGVIDGAGSNASMNSDNMGNNHVGATGSGFFYQQCCSGPFPGSSNSSFSFSPINQPSTYFYSAGGTITINGPAFNGGSMWGGSGNNMSIDILSRVIHFGLDISGGNGSGINVTTSCLPYGGQGGAGLYIIARVAILNGTIILNGGNGTCSNPNVYPCSGGNYSCSGAGGGGSCLLRSTSFQSNNFQFVSNGGQTSNSSVNGGNGAMLVIQD